MKNLSRFIFSGLALIVSMVMMCAVDPVSDGSVSETTNGIMATIVYPDGNPCVHCGVRIRPADYTSALPDSSAGNNPPTFDSVTDVLGIVRINDIEAGNYVIEVNDEIGEAIALRIAVPELDSLLDFGVDTIRPTGAVRGSILHAPATQFYVQAIGLERLIRVDMTSGTFIMADLPKGVVGLRIVPEQPLVSPLYLDDITIISNDTVVLEPIDMLSGDHKVILNTTASGADVSEDVYNFPLCIRLTAANFNFSKARGGGRDMRFFNHHDQPLVFDIERWDSASALAELWVRVDTILGNNGTQYIQMFWGDSAREAAPASLTVFDTAIGFQGVWHFNESGGASCLDATVNQYNGTAYNMGPESAVAGAIGPARAFNGVTTYFQMHGSAPYRLNMPQNGSYSVSAWVHMDTHDSSNQVILSKGNEQYFLKARYNDSTKGYFWEFVEYHDQAAWQVTDGVAEVNTWKYVAGVRDGDQEYLYVDGICVDSVVSVVPDTMHRDTGNDFTIGRYIQAIHVPDEQGFSYFKGILDEVRISNNATSPGWIKLCYANQGMIDRLVYIEASGSRR